jgi:hypothetical protein
MIIIGAGMAGLLAGGMIRGQKVTVYESAKDLPNNHSAVLRFRSSIVGDVLGIEFKAVQMMKCVEKYNNPVADNLAYSLKCNGIATLRSIMSADASVQTRYIAPHNLIQLMADRINGSIEFSKVVESEDLKRCGTPVISTIPMPTLMQILDYPDKPIFRFVNGYNINAIIHNMDAYASVYVPSPLKEYNRISATGNRMTMEYSMPHSTNAELTSKVQLLNDNEDLLIRQAREGAFALGILEPDFEKVTVSVQKYSKILPIEEGDRKRFIMWASDTYGIYSLGRFATWRPGLLLDDLVQDVRVIQRIIRIGSYDHRKK